MAINIINTRTSGAVGEYVGRGSPLGNPFPISKTMDRSAVCEKYDAWFNKQIAEKNEAVLNELRRLYVVHRKQGSMQLRCFCAPQKCHAETIKRFLLNHIEASK